MTLVVSLITAAYCKLCGLLSSFQGYVEILFFLCIDGRDSLRNLVYHIVNGPSGGSELKSLGA